ncbi:MAG: hypothetical protein KDJ49_06730 [Alphaproteobacteria bacterium]|nr:hypothetical protein [Alphaproteobacteria bacterium]USO07439.1 MAG: hypothetical protein H6866_08495 [Rhodospirillales bacterium]
MMNGYFRLAAVVYACAVMLAGYLAVSAIMDLHGERERVARLDDIRVEADRLADRALELSRISPAAGGAAAR